MSEEKKNAGVTSSRITFCDLRCPHADFPKQTDIDGAKSCRTFVALYCKQLDRIVSKNAPCAVKFGHRRPKSNL